MKAHDRGDPVALLNILSKAFEASLFHQNTMFRSGVLRKDHFFRHLMRFLTNMHGSDD
jgi:hypothetical protein